MDSNPIIKIDENELLDLIAFHYEEIKIQCTVFHKSFEDRTTAHAYYKMNRVCSLTKIKKEIERLEDLVRILDDIDESNREDKR